LSKYKQIENDSKNLIYFYYIKATNMENLITKAFAWFSIIAYEILVSVFALLAFITLIGTLAAAYFYWIF